MRGRRAVHLQRPGLFAVPSASRRVVESAGNDLAVYGSGPDR